MKEIVGNPLHLTSLNHVSLICRSVEESIDFYQNVIGFVPIIRPGSFDFDGAWLFGFGIGIHLLQSEDPENCPRKQRSISRIIISLFSTSPVFCPALPQKSQQGTPIDNSTVQNCESMGAVEKKLKEMEIKYKRARVEEGGIHVINCSSMIQMVS
ncbi:hypothetical protein Dsin_013430 [Dipteronia sinensis]|uniref:Glyoxalase/fosfomycin resistance/dioxygenase domain-containing protein n=1 Tax=Dipteronia sinensis TaxID=43782 RepID=A0AAE0EAK3_9ROSI|nr:hypothetical protein Dsin_013430 [Dipteronia sinensis]